jgi:hypothetical protein
MNRYEDPGLSDDYHEAFCLWMEQSALEVKDVIDMTMSVLNMGPQEEGDHGGRAARTDTGHLDTARPATAGG